MKEKYHDSALKEAENNEWEVWRQDDNGNRFRIRSGLTESQARASVAKFEASAHKQTYWAERATELDRPTTR